MKHIPLLLAVILLTGCTGTSTNRLHADAMGCGKELIIEPNGIVRTPTEQEKKAQCMPLWDAYNKRMDALAKAEARRKEKEGPDCGSKLIAWCDWTGCRCISRQSYRKIFRRAGMY